MATPIDLAQLEQQTYRDSYLDGVIDLAIGFSLLWIGAMWLWVPSLAAMAGLFPAVTAPVAVQLRKQIVDDRSGYVKWSAERRKTERHTFLALAALGMAVLALGVGLYLASRDSGPGDGITEWLLPGLIAFILAAMSIGIGFIVQHWRLFLYALLLVAGGVATSAVDGNPGWPLLGAGVCVTLVGARMLAGFLRANPLVIKE